MQFKKHPDLIGKHAFLSPSNYSWLNYNEQKLTARFYASQAARQPHRPPRQVPIGEEVSLDVLRATRAPEAIDGDVGEPGDHHDPVERMHRAHYRAYRCWRSHNSKRVTTCTLMTRTSVRRKRPSSGVSSGEVTASAPRHA